MIKKLLFFQVMVNLNQPIPPVQMNQLPQQVQMTATSQNLSLARDIQGIDHIVGASSTIKPGITYVAVTDPPFSAYTEGQFFIFYPDVPLQAGATLNLNGIGPMVINGTCSNICFLITYPTPPNQFLVR
jgi:hypothetical protein